MPALLPQALQLADRAGERIPTPELNRFVADVVAKNPPPSRRGRRLRLYYAAQVGERPPRVAIQVNDRKLITRDWAYHLENRMRETYGLEGVPLVIDFVPRSGRAARRLARAESSRLSAMPKTKPLAEDEYLFTSESVTEGHPDKVTDQISDGVLDAIMAEDPEGRVACETLVNTGMAVVSGEISTEVHLDIPEIVRETIREIGYDHGDYGYNCDHISILVSLDKQSPDIAQGVDVALRDPGRPRRRRRAATSPAPATRE